MHGVAAAAGHNGGATMSSQTPESSRQPADSDITETASKFEMTASEEAWDLLAQLIEDFVQAWEDQNSPPSLTTFLPETIGPLRHMTLLEIIKIDLEYRWVHHSFPRTVEEYLADYPELAQDGFPCDLVYEEFHVRRQAGDEVDAVDFLERFPEHAEPLGKQLGVDSPYASTSLFQAKSADRLQHIQPGDKLDDFELLATLGKGAFATVYLSRQTSMQRLVALKVSADHGDEPQTLAQFDHENIVRVYDQRSLSEEGLRLLYMQYVPGGTLHSVVDLVRESEPQKRNGTMLLKAVDRALDNHGESAPAESSLRKRLNYMSWPEVICWMGSRLATALGYAHRRGVLHRDVKPANVLITGEGSPKLADFNISFSAEVSKSTPAAYFGGSLPYMSPEQLEAFHPGHTREAESLDERCDLYSLGVMLWELLTGYRPFRDGHLDGGWMETLDKMIERRRDGVRDEAIRDLPADLPHGLKEVLLSCLSPDPEERPRSGEELAQQLNLCLQPRLQELLNPPPKSWPRAVLSFPMTSLVIAAFVPNVLAAIFNLIYNERAIVNKLAETNPEAVPFFKELIVWINGIAFPVGLGLAGFLAAPVFRAIKTLGQGGTVDDERINRLWRRILNLGHYAAMIGITLWTVAGIAYPVSIHVAIGEVPPSIYPHFFASLVICGLIAASYPFLLVTFLTLRAYYPALLSLERLAQQDFARFAKVSRRAGVYFVLAVLIILVSILALILASDDDKVAKFAMVTLCLAGIAGSYPAFRLFRAIQADLAVLAIPAARRGSIGDVDSESVEAIASGTWRP